MRPNNNSTKKIRKFRLLLDAAFAKANLFPKLRKKANLAHVVHDGGLSAHAADENIYKLAVKENRFIITHDDDFKKLVKSNKPGAFIVPPYLNNKDIDSLVTKFISGKDPEDYLGKAIKI